MSRAKKETYSNGYDALLQRFEDLEQHIRQCDKHRMEIVKDLASQQSTIEDHEQDLRSLAPRPNDKWKMIAALVSVLSAIVGGVYFVNKSFAERPTTVDVQRIVEPNTKDIKEIRTEQSEQRRILDRLDYSMDDMHNALKEIRDGLKKKGR